jgi:hypothetical protein
MRRIRTGRFELLQLFLQYAQLDFAINIFRDSVFNTAINVPNSLGLRKIVLVLLHPYPKTVWIRMRLDDVDENVITLNLTSYLEQI